jgi:hypothetical protein
MLRSIQNPAEQATLLFMKPTPYRTGLNRYRLLCNTCSDLYYVDDNSFYLATVALQRGMDNPFCCDDCQEGFHWNFAE